MPGRSGVGEGGKTGFVRKGLLAARRMRRGVLPDLLLTAAIAALIWASIGLHLVQERQQVESDALQEARNLARSAAESMNRTVAGIDRTLLFVRSAYAADPAAFDLVRWVRRN